MYLGKVVSQVPRQSLTCKMDRSCKTTFQPWLSGLLLGASQPLRSLYPEASTGSKRFGHGPTQLFARSPPAVRGQALLLLLLHSIMSSTLSLRLHRSTRIAFRSFEGQCFVHYALSAEFHSTAASLRPPPTSTSRAHQSVNTAGHEHCHCPASRES